MTPFIPLEIAVQREFCRREPFQRAALQVQFAAAVVESRDNFGNGFCTRFSVDRAVAPPVGSEAVLGYVQVELDGYKDPMAVMVLIDDGYAYCIEGSTARRSLAGVDLAELNFRIVPSRA